MARAGALLFLVALLAATVCVSKVAASRQLIGEGLVDLVVDVKLDLKLKLSISNECTRGVVVTVLEDLKNKKEDAKDKVVEVKKGTEGSLGPIQVKLAVAKLLNLQIAVLGDDGKLLTVVVKVDLNKVERLLSGLVKVVLRVVEDVDAKVVKVFCGGDLLVVIGVALRV